MQKRLFRIIAIALLGSPLVLVCLLAITIYLQACPTYPTTKRSTIPSIPAPPGAIGVTATRLFPPTPEQNNGFLRVQTTLSPLEALRFYETQLPKEGWQPSQVQTSDMMLIINKQACPFYGLQFAARKNGNMTDVVIDPYLNDICDCN